MKFIKWGFITGLTVLTGCGESSETTTTTTTTTSSSTTTLNVDDILGAWERELSFPGEPGSETVVIDFVDDGTCTIAIVEKDDSWSCEYSADGVNFTITDEGCDEPGAGSYTYSIAQDILTFSLVSDPCEDREMGITGDWDRL